jgi:hypothetical protein
VGYIAPFDAVTQDVKDGVDDLPVTVRPGPSCFCRFWHQLRQHRPFAILYIGRVSLSVHTSALPASSTGF